MNRCPVKDCPFDGNSWPEGVVLADCRKCAQAVKNFQNRTVNFWDGIIDNNPDAMQRFVKITNEDSKRPKKVKLKVNADRYAEYMKLLNWTECPKEASLVAGVSLVEFVKVCKKAGNGFRSIVSNEFFRRWIILEVDRLGGRAAIRIVAGKVGYSVKIIREILREEKA